MQSLKHYVVTEILQESSALRLAGDSEALAGVGVDSSAQRGLAEHSGMLGGF